MFNIEKFALDEAKTLQKDLLLGEFAEKLAPVLPEDDIIEVTYCIALAHQRGILEGFKTFQNTMLRSHLNPSEN